MPALSAQSRDATPGGVGADVLGLYRAIERASHDMLEAARGDDWDRVARLERECAVLISKLQQETRETPLAADVAQSKSRIMQRILANDAEIRTLAEAWFEQVYDVHAGRPLTLH